METVMGKRNAVADQTPSADPVAVIGVILALGVVRSIKRSGPDARKRGATKMNCETRAGQVKNYPSQNLSS
jgi:hypothetical protein